MKKTAIAITSVAVLGLSLGACSSNSASSGQSPAAGNSAAPTAVVTDLVVGFKQQFPEAAAKMSAVENAAMVKLIDNLCTGFKAANTDLDGVKGALDTMLDTNVIKIDQTQIPQFAQLVQSYCASK